MTTSSKYSWLGVGAGSTADPLQLSLWAEDMALPHWPTGMPETVARALVPPGWWPQLRVLWTELASVRVYRCEERGGFLTLDADTAEGALRDQLAPARLKALVERTCAACGGAGVWCCVGEKATPVVACSGCRERLDQGETIAGIADQVFAWDGRFRIERTTPRVALRSPLARTRSPIGAERDFDLPMNPGDLRATFHAIHAHMRAEVVGQKEALASLALLGALQVGGGLPRGPRALMIGPTGAGKSHLLGALVRSLEPWRLPSLQVDAVELTSPGWAGAPSIGQLLEVALTGETASARARRMVVVIDEIHHVAFTPGAMGNMHAKRAEIFASLLALTGGSPVQLGETKRAWDSTQALVIVAGAFTGRDLTRGVGVESLVRWGFPAEFANRVTETVIRMSPPDLASTAGILRSWPALRSLVGICESLGLPVTIPEETIGRAAQAAVEAIAGATIRTAAGWLLTALRAQLLARLSDGATDPIGISPDELPIRYSGAESGDEPDPGQDFDSDPVWRKR